MQDILVPNINDFIINISFIKVFYIHEGMVKFESEIYIYCDFRYNIESVVQLWVKNQTISSSKIKTVRKLSFPHG